MSRTYNIKMQTPLGIKRGQVTFNINGTSLNGTIIGEGFKSYFSNGLIVNKAFKFSGTLSSVFLSFNYEAHGSINKKLISGSAKTKYGVFNFVGSEP